jgi:hypothetical protein
LNGYHGSWKRNREMELQEEDGDAGRGMELQEEGCGSRKRAGAPGRWMEL